MNTNARAATFNNAITEMEPIAALLFPVDGRPFLIRDKVAEKKYGFSLARSIEQAHGQRLLQGYRVHVTKSVRPEPYQMKGSIHLIAV